MSEESAWRRARAVFEEVVALDPTVRREAIDSLCGGDAALRAEVESLLRASDEAGAFLDDGHPLLDSDLPGAVPETIGAYRVVRELGRGGMGAVYLGEREQGDFAHRVAIKVVRAGLGSELVMRRFRAERQILAGLEHSGIARLYDAGLTAQGVPYLVMEYVEGENLLGYCAGRDLGLRARLTLFARVCEAVRYAHRHLVVHRDIKPSNILITADGEPKLLDFGLARLVQPTSGSAGSPETVTSLRWMTPEYASPEQVRGEPVTTATDVYSLGVVLFELLTGLKPYRTKTTAGAELEQAILEQEPERASTVARERSERRLLRGDLDTICAKCLQKDPQRRYGGAAELAEDLQRYLQGKAVRARPDSAAYRLRKFVYRHRWGVGVTAAAVITLAALGSIYTVGLRRERDRARMEARRAEQISTFLTDVFRTAGEPAAAKPTTADLLQRGVERVDSIDADPELQSTLLLTLGIAYRNAGLHPQAEALLRRALTLRETLFGSDSLEAAEALENLGKELRMSARYPEAKDCLERALRIRRQVLPPDDPALAASLDALAGVYWNLGDYGAAVEMIQRGVAVMEVARPDDPDLDRMRGNLGQALETIGEPARAREVYRKMLEHAERLGGAEGPNVVFAVLGLGTCALADEDFDEAQRELERAEVLMLKQYGPRHPSTALARTALGLAVAGRGDLERARGLLDEALVANEAMLGPDHPDTAATLVASGKVRRSAGELDRASAELRRALAIRERALGPEAAQIAEVLVEASEVALLTNRPAAAEELLRRALAIERRELTGEHRDLVPCLTNLGRALRAQGREAEAQPLIEEALAIARRSLPAGHHQRLAVERLADIEVGSL